jgi:hypothetical protein
VCVKFSGLTYAKAVTACQDIGGDIAQPMNELDTSTLSVVLANFTANMTRDRFYKTPLRPKRCRRFKLVKQIKFTKKSGKVIFNSNGHNSRLCTF